MVDQTSQFYAILTNVGAAKQANADALGVAWKITQMGVGDANGTDPTPNATQTSLINEWRRAPLNQLKVDDNNSAIIIAEQVIPADVGGKWIREIALYDADGDMVAVANCAPTYKPLLSQGSRRTQVVRMNLVVSSASNVQLKIDPAVVLATREYVDSRLVEEISKLDNKQSVRAATTANITLSGLRTVDGVVLAAGDRILVKNQTEGKENGLYIVAAGAWSRTSDADTSAEVTPGLVVAVEQGATQADTIWQLITDAPIVLGTTALSFRDITDGFARLLSPAFTGTPTVPTPPQFDATQKVVNAEFLKRMGVEYGGYVNYPVSTTLTQEDCGKLVAFSHPTNALVATLPTGGGITPGVTVTVLCSQGTLTVTAASGDSIGAINAPGNIALAQGDTAEFIRNGTNLWYLIGGSVLLRYAAVMRGANWVTPPQFDNTQKLATTEFVQRSAGNFRGSFLYNTAETLTAEHCGSDIELYGSVSRTITLPLLSAVGGKSAIRFINLATVNMTIACQGADGFLTSPASTSIVLEPCDTVELHSFNGWVIMGGSLALKGAGVMAGPNWVTPPRFDNSKRLATTEFIKSNGLSLSRFNAYTVSAALPATVAGSAVEFYGSTAGQTLMLPLSSDVRSADAILLFNYATVPVTIARQGADLIGSGGGGGVASMTLLPGDSVSLLAGTNLWFIVGGTAASQFSGSFRASLGVTGYQVLPSGLIRQWGISGAATAATPNVDIVFPVAFPNALLTLNEHDYTGSGGNTRSFWQFSAQTKSGVRCTNLCAITGGSPPQLQAPTAAQCSWEAWGY